MERAQYFVSLLITARLTRVNTLCRAVESFISVFNFYLLMSVLTLYKYNESDYILKTTVYAIVDHGLHGQGRSVCMEIFVGREHRTCPPPPSHNCPVVRLRFRCCISGLAKLLQFAIQSWVRVRYFPGISSTSGVGPQRADSVDGDTEVPTFGVNDTGGAQSIH